MINTFISFVIVLAISLNEMSIGMQPGNVIPSSNESTMHSMQLTNEPIQQSEQQTLENGDNLHNQGSTITHEQSATQESVVPNSPMLQENNGGQTNFSLRFDAMEEINQYGQNIIDHAASDIYRNITTEQEQQLTHFVMARNFSPYKVSLVWWKFIRAISDPISCLAQLATTVLPMLSFGSDGNSFDTYQKVIISICGVVSLAFGQICGYAKNKVREQEKMEILLHAVKSGKIQLNNEAAQAEDDEQIGAQV